MIRILYCTWKRLTNLNGWVMLRVLPHFNHHSKMRVFEVLTVNVWNLSSVAGIVFSKEGNNNILHQHLNIRLVATMCSSSRLQLEGSWDKIVGNGAQSLCFIDAWSLIKLTMPFLKVLASPKKDAVSPGAPFESVHPVAEKTWRTLGPYERRLEIFTPRHCKTPSRQHQGTWWPRDPGSDSPCFHGNPCFRQGR